MICSMAMALFVMRYTVNRIEKTISKDKAILEAYMRQRVISVGKPAYKEGKPISISDKYALPFYHTKDKPTTFRGEINGEFLWVLGGKI